MRTRREFMTLLGGVAAAAWPLPVQAQRPERTRRIGWLDGISGADPETLARLDAFRGNLRRSDGSRVAQWRLLLVLMPSTRIEAGLM